MAWRPNVLLTSIIGRNATSSSEVNHAHGDGNITKSHMKEKEKYKELEFLSARHELRPRIVHEKEVYAFKKRGFTLGETLSRLCFAAIIVRKLFSLGHKL